MKLSQMLVASGFFKSVANADQAAAKIIAGQELGFGPIASLNGIYIVDGKVGVMSGLIASRIKSSGRYDYLVDVNTETECSLTFFESGRRRGVSSFTIADADAAGLRRGKAVWSQYPRNMLFARALTNGARWYCPDVFNGPVYTPEELGAEIVIEADGNEKVTSLPAPAAAVPDAVAGGRHGSPVAPAPAPAVPTRDYREEICPVHSSLKDNTFFKRGKMRSYAHPVAEGIWCDWERIHQSYMASVISKLRARGDTWEMLSTAPETYGLSGIPASPKQAQISLLIGIDRTLSKIPMPRSAMFEEQAAPSAPAGNGGAV